MPDQRVTRRHFLKTTGLGATGAATLGVMAVSRSAPLPVQAVDQTAVVAAMGNTLIPSDPGDAGYETLEPYNITAEVLKGLNLTDEDLGLFDQQAAVLYSGKSFLQLGETEREAYFEAVFSGEQFEDGTGQRLLRVLEQVRRGVFRVYYNNYPQHTLPRDSDGLPIFPDGDMHQITNPNSKELVTGWDVADFPGPLTWEEEERRRELLKDIDWQE